MRKKTFAALVVFAMLLQTFLIVVAQAAATNEVDKIVFVHYGGNAKARPPPADSGDYKLMGVVWRTLKIPYAVNFGTCPVTDENAVRNAILISANEWDDGAWSDPWSGTSADLFANYVSSNVPSTDISVSAFDGVNAIFWVDMGESSTIAVTTVYYYRASRTIVEFDMQFNKHYGWGTSGGSTVMDIQNIATHEFGHTVGLADLYRSTTSRETMYGYSWEGDTTKRDLYLGDQAGIIKLYG